MFERHMSVQSTWLHHRACHGHYSWALPLAHHPLFSWDGSAQPFRKAINPLKANKLQVGVVHVSGAGPGRADKNVLLSC